MNDVPHTTDRPLFTPPPQTASIWARTGRALLPTLRYWMETEVHVYAFSVAANVLLSFFPFLIVMVSLCRNVFHWSGAEQAIYFALNDYFPGDVDDFIRRNLLATLWRQGPIQYVSLLLLFFTANGIFEPLEVALNRAWGVTKNRSYLKNQLVSLGLIFLCGGLVLFSTVLTAVNQNALAKTAGVATANSFVSELFFKAAAVPMSILMLFLIYWLLPNRRVAPKHLIVPSIVIGLLLELLKYLNSFTWFWFRNKLDHEYGPFKYSVAIIFWSFIASLLVLAGAEWTARRRAES